MSVIGIISEYNPFHSGHGYHIAASREMLGPDTAVVAVMSGNWVQRGEFAIADKWTRAKLAVCGGADLVLELPTVWAMSSAESFARGGVAILAAAGVVDRLSFGSECGNVAQLAQVADCLDSPAYIQELRARLNGGATFAVCRQQAIEALLGADLAALLSTPNNNLGVEYMRALRKLDSGITPMTITLLGARHGSIEALNAPPSHLSATQIRGMLLEGALDAAAPWLPRNGSDILKENTITASEIKAMERVILSHLRTMTAEDWTKMPDSGFSEGLPQRLERAGKQCASLSEFFELTKTKRYTHARLERLVMWAYLGLTAEDIPSSPPYLRVLAFNERGQEILKQMKRSAALPIITKPAHARELEREGRRLFELESCCTDLYDLCHDPIPTPGREWRTDPIRVEGRHG